MPTRTRSFAVAPQKDSAEATVEAAWNISSYSPPAPASATAAALVSAAAAALAAFGLEAVAAELAAFGFETVAFGLEAVAETVEFGL